MNRPPEAVGPSEAFSECKGDACCYSKRPLLFASVMPLGERVPSRFAAAERALADPPACAGKRRFSLFGTQAPFPLLGG